MSEIVTLADIEAIEQIPLSERNLPPNTYEALQRGASIDPEKIALSFFFFGTAYAQPVDFTFRELMGQITQAANMFHDLAIGKEDVLSVILPNLPQSHFALWGGEAAGIVNPINPSLDATAMAEIMNAVGTKVVVTLAPFPQMDLWQKVASIADQVPSLTTILQVDLLDYLWGTKRLWAKSTRLLSQYPTVKAKMLDFDATLQRYPADRLTTNRTIQPDDIASYIDISDAKDGSKVAQYTHFSQVFGAWTVGEAIDLQTHKAVFCGLPLSHIDNAITMGLMAWYKGAAAVLGTPQGYQCKDVIANFWKIIDYYQLSFFSALPSIYHELLDAAFFSRNLATLEYALCSTAPLSADLCQRIENNTGVSILEGYHLNESSCISSLNPAFGDRYTGSVGYRIPYQAMKAVLIDRDGSYRRDCQPNEIGHIILQGPNLFQGYKKAAQNDTAWLDIGDSKGLWFNSGDMGRIDEEGYLWLTEQ